MNPLIKNPYTTEFQTMGIQQQFEEVRDLLASIRTAEQLQEVNADGIIAIAQITSDIQSLIETHRRYLRPLLPK